MSNSNNSKKTHVVYLTVISLLVIAIGVLGWAYYRKNQQYKYVVVKIENTAAEKENITQELNSLLAEYDKLKTNNDTLNVRLSKEQTRIAELLEEIKKTKNASAYQINQYKKELATLREIMKSYIVQIDELNTKNQELTAENIKVRTEYYKEQTNNKELSQKNEELTTKVTKAAAIKTKNLRYRLLNKKGKETTKLSKIDKVEICFTLTENEITPPGTKDVYLRIARPDELVLASSAEDFFMFQGAKIAYTAKRQVDYQNKDVDMCVYWANKAEDLIPGKYIVDIFADGNLIGSINFELK